MATLNDLKVNEGRYRQENAGRNLESNETAAQILPVERQPLQGHDGNA